MARDYKYRAQPQPYSRRKAAPRRGGEWRWLLIIVLVGAFAAFLIYLRSSEQGGEKTPPTTQVVVKSQPPKPNPKPNKPFEPTFDFYTILPEQEVVVSEPEIKTRAREESIGKSKNAQYVIQAGSFRNRQDAEKVKAQLTALGIEAKIEAAKNGTATWHRVKIGPLSKMTKVDAIRSRLHARGIDAVVMQLGQ